MACESDDPFCHSSARRGISRGKKVGESLLFNIKRAMRIASYLLSPTQQLTNVTETDQLGDRKACCAGRVENFHLECAYLSFIKMPVFPLLLFAFPLSALHLTLQLFIPRYHIDRIMRVTHKGGGVPSWHLLLLLVYLACPIYASLHRLTSTTPSACEPSYVVLSPVFEAYLLM